MRLLLAHYLVVEVIVEVRQEAHEVSLPDAQEVPALLLILVKQVLLVLLVLVDLVLDLLVLLLLPAEESLLDLLVLLALLVQKSAHQVQLQQKKGIRYAGLHALFQHMLHCALGSQLALEGRPGTIQRRSIELAPNTRCSRSS